MTSEELYQKVRRNYDGIGQATVYRTLKLLADSGLAKAVEFGDGAMRYEILYGQSHHDHLICESCGVNVEVVDPAIERLQEEVAKRHGFRHRMATRAGRNVLRARRLKGRQRLSA